MSDDTLTAHERVMLRREERYKKTIDALRAEIQRLTRDIADYQTALIDADEIRKTAEARMEAAEKEVERLTTLYDSAVKNRDYYADERAKERYRAEVAEKEARRIKESTLGTIEVQRKIAEAGAKAVIAHDELLARAEAAEGEVERLTRENEELRKRAPGNGPGPDVDDPGICYGK